MKIRSLQSPALGCLLALLAGCGAPSSGDGFETASSSLTTTDGRVSAVLSYSSDWGTGYCANVRISNLGATATNTWSVVINLNQTTITSSWSGQFSISGSQVTVTPVSFNAVLAPGAYTDVGFCANAPSASARPVLTSVTQSGSTGNGSGGSGGTGGTSATGGSSTGGSATGGAGGSTCTPTTYQAESITHSTGAATPGGWNIWANGYVSTNHTFVAGPSTITVVAAGSSAGGIWPNMVVTVGGVQIGSATVSTTSWTSYRFPFTATAGTQEIQVQFTNDAVVGSEDRNLLVDQFTVSCGTGGTTGGTGGTTGGTGGTTGGTGGTTGQLTAQQAAKLMSPGWNLGNSYDAVPNETAWGNPTPSQSLINTVHSAGFMTLRLPVTWTNHIGSGPSYTIDPAWMAKVKQTAQWAIDAGMYVFVNTHHDADGNSGWVTFPSTTSAAQSVAAEVTAIWTQIATTFQSFNSRLMLECFNEPSLNTGNNTQTRADLNLYLEACYSAIRHTGGANATRIIMIQPIGASPVQAGIQAMQQVSFINDPNIVISLHTYYPTNFGLSTTPYNWGSSSDYTSMQNSIQQIRSWLPTQVVFVGEWGSMGAQATANRAAHALAYAQDTTTGNIVPVWWDNGGSGSGSYALFSRTTGAQTYPTIVSGLMTGVSHGLSAPNNWATLANP